MNRKEKLFDQFPSVSTEQWMSKIREDLKGADFDSRLIWRTDEGFEIKPFYRKSDTEDIHYSDAPPGTFPFVRGGKTGDNSWFIRQDIRVTDFEESNGRAMEILMRGIDSVGFVISDPLSVNADNLGILLEGIYTDIVELNFLCSGKAIEILEGLTGISDKRGLSPESVRGAVETDPLGRLMLNGGFCVTPGEGFNYLATLTKLAIPYPNLKTIHLNASNFCDAGAGVTLQLALALSAGNEYLVQLTGRGISAQKAASKMRFSFGIDSDYFAGIAGLRASRLLWSLIQKGYGTAEDEISRMQIHCTTARWNKTIYDPYVNMLRTQTEAMSAILGGTDSLTIGPFDSVFRNPDEFSERIARNQQLILREEAYFDKVADPAAGSYYIENLTSMIAERAWGIFLELEEQGGFLECLKKGLVQKKLEESAAKRRNAISSKEAVLLGTNQYPSANEKITSKPAEQTGRRGFSPVDIIVKPVRLFRGAGEFESIRMAVDSLPAAPVVFLLTVGNPVMRKARARFSSNFFGCAGYTIIDNPGFSTPEEGMAAAEKAGPDIVVICSSDEEYPVIAPVIFNVLKDKAIVVIAGNPACAGELRKHGIENFIYTGISMTEELKRYNDNLGIEMRFEQESYEAEIQL
ncbi:MAG TPA: methylmalonyl-CoA mutase family protein [Bacteroidales bacterium]|nr:methylmalonyl-CoA mutase family protein [Bacteroidales bacterium]